MFQESWNLDPAGCAPCCWSMGERRREFDLHTRRRFVDTFPVRCPPGACAVLSALLAEIARNIGRGRHLTWINKIKNGRLRDRT
jgi:hypothetical protein